MSAVDERGGDQAGRTHDHAAVRGAIGGVLCVWGLSLLSEYGSVPEGYQDDRLIEGGFLLLLGLPLLGSCLPGRARRPGRWVAAVLFLVAGGLVGYLGVAGAISGGWGVFMAMLLVPIALLLIVPGLLSISWLRRTRPGVDPPMSVAPPRPDREPAGGGHAMQGPDPEG